MWLCDPETGVLLWLTGIWNYSQSVLAAVSSSETSFTAWICWSLYIKTSVFKSIKILLCWFHGLKKNKHKATHKDVNFTSPVTCYGDSTSSQNQGILLRWIYIACWVMFSGGPGSARLREDFSNLNDSMGWCWAPFLLLLLMLFPIPLYIFFLPYLFPPICFPALLFQLASSFGFLLRHKI